jgi:hypothetical protein
VNLKQTNKQKTSQVIDLDSNQRTLFVKQKTNQKTKTKSECNAEKVKYETDWWQTWQTYAVDGVE